MQQPTLGRIVRFFSRDLPNGMQSAPAIVNQVFGDSKCNLSVMVANSLNPVVAAFSIDHKSKTASQDQDYWLWPQEAEQPADEA